VLMLPSAITKPDPPFNYEVSPILHIWKTSDYRRHAGAAAVELHCVGYDWKHLIPPRRSESV
jgi:hypothetical protein